MIAINKEQGHVLKQLFEHSTETMVWSFLQGHMGRGLADQIKNPSIGAIATGDICFLCGDSGSEDAEALVRGISREAVNPFIFIVPEDEGWEKRIVSCYPEAHCFIRYATKKDTVFDRDKLRRYAAHLPAGFTVHRIDAGLYRACMDKEFSRDLCSQFETAAAYEEKGLGFVVLKDGQVVCGASSYTVYDNGLEIEIDTDEPFRRRGLAAACAARLILECLDRGLYPSWDAANPESIALAEKLGYERDYQYAAYMVSLTGAD